MQSMPLMQDALKANVPVTQGVKQHLKDLMSFHHRVSEIHRTVGVFLHAMQSDYSGKQLKVKKNNIKYKVVAVKLEAVIRNNNK